MRKKDAIEPRSQPPARLTYYVVQGFKAAPKNGLSADDPVQARDREHAMRIFERLKLQRAGVVAFCRSGVPDLGEWDDATILARHGRLPAEVDNLGEGLLEEVA